MRLTERVYLLLSSRDEWHYTNSIYVRFCILFFAIYMWIFWQVVFIYAKLAMFHETRRNAGSGYSENFHQDTSQIGRYIRYEANRNFEILILCM